MTVRAQFPAVRSSLDLNFARTKRLDPRITFTRASTGTFVSSNGLIQSAASNVPRFDHNPSTGESLGLLVEEARTNLLLNSAKPVTDNGGATFANNTTVLSPSGSVDGQTVSVTGQYGAGETRYLSVAPATTVAVSVYVKPLSTTDYFHLFFRGGGNQGFGASYRFSTLQAVNATRNGGTAISSSITAVGNGWYRLAVIGNNTSAGRSTLDTMEFAPSDQLGQPGAAGPSAVVFAAQLETGAFPTSYIPTTTATVTRAADIASITGTNFSSWNNLTAGTFVSNFRAQGPATFSINGAGGIYDRLIFLEDSGVRIRQQLITDAAPVYDQTPYAVYSKTAANKFAFALTSGSQASALNGTLGGVGTATSIFIPTSMQIGRETALGNYLNGTIADLAYYPVRLPNAQLQELTK